ncbi:hypothetical protein V6N11_056369 [Hibiscus sabdariffa]|uniref:Uncharacterized protein n=1 Tax=Hibiscus sabdariffa TaxID=183260 RepID=A0ABR2T3L8_9ROSI
MKWYTYLDEYEKLVIRMTTPRVVIDNVVCPIATLVKVDGVRRDGILLDVVQVLADQNLSIKKAYVSSYGQWANESEFVHDDGKWEVFQRKPKNEAGSNGARPCGSQNSNPRPWGGGMLGNAGSGRGTGNVWPNQRNDSRIEIDRGNPRPQMVNNNAKVEEDNDACQGAHGATDWYYGLHPLVTHAKTTKRARNVKLYQELAELLDEELLRKGTLVVPTSKAYGKWRGLKDDEKDH